MCRQEASRNFFIYIYAVTCTAFSETKYYVHGKSSTKEIDERKAQHFNTKVFVFDLTVLKL